MRKHIDIEGMSCEHCANAVKSALEELGAVDITVDYLAGYANAEIDAEDDEIIEKIADEGFEIEKIVDLHGE